MRSFARCCCSSTKHWPIAALAASSVTTMKCQGWALAPDGACRAASRIISTCARGISAGAKARLVMRERTTSISDS